MATSVNYGAEEDWIRNIANIQLDFTKAVEKEVLSDIRQCRAIIGSTGLLARWKSVDLLILTLWETQILSLLNGRDGYARFICMSRPAVLSLINRKLHYCYTRWWKKGATWFDSGSTTCTYLCMEESLQLWFRPAGTCVQKKDGEMSSEQVFTGKLSLNNSR